jgi:prepilin peptidase CpaA
MLMEICAVGFVVACWVADVRERRIPNQLTGPALLVGVIVNLALFGVTGLFRSLAGVAVALAVLLPPFALGGIGGGDVKMMGAVGALLGPLPTAASLVIGMILGGIIMVAHLVRLGRLQETVGSLYRMVIAAVGARSLAPLKPPAGRPDAIALPYSVPLGLATVAVVALRRVAGG